uniref:Uncharacterized protein n=1 Tax=Knipowitschia caucasica TaxID=637954 RepID=A0AAV2JPH1_KNICA
MSEDLACFAPGSGGVGAVSSFERFVEVSSCQILAKGRALMKGLFIILMGYTNLGNHGFSRDRAERRRIRTHTVVQCIQKADACKQTKALGGGQWDRTPGNGCPS